MRIHTITRIVQWVLILLSLGLIIAFYVGPVVPGTENTPSEEPRVTETILGWAFILTFIAAGAVLIFSVITSIMNPKGAKKSLVGLLIAAVLIFIAYQLAGDELLVLSPNYRGGDNVPGTLKSVGTGLIFMYFLGGIAILSILVTEIINIFR